jgi:hypothetical protein
MADARRCLSEAAKLRELADVDQKEVDAVDQHLKGAMGGAREGKPTKNDSITQHRFLMEARAPKERMGP